MKQLITFLFLSPARHLSTFFIARRDEVPTWHSRKLQYSGSPRLLRSLAMTKIYILFVMPLLLESAWAHDLQKYEAYLNNLKTLSGNFIQVNSKGHKATGTIYIARPGKMRLNYNPPSSLLVVADGKWLVTYDRETDEPNYVSLENTPAAFILRPHIRFSGDIAVTSIIPKGETIEISLVRKEEADSGTLSLVFSNNPISLKEWSITDAQGVETRVILSKIKSNVPLPPELFVIKSPTLIQQIF